MKNVYAIGGVSRHLSKVAEHIERLAMDIHSSEQDAGNLEPVYSDLLFDELEHAQVLTLKLTELISQSQDGSTGNADGADGSAFGPGNLDSQNKVKGDGAEEGADAT